MGGDSQTLEPGKHDLCFNPRPRVGGDLNLPASLGIQSAVSIHAPAWGATPWVRRRQHGPDVSIHAPAWGATRYTVNFASQSWFQSTPPRGGRPARRGPPANQGLVSIHAPAWGATRAHLSAFVENPRFQSTPPRGGRPLHPQNYGCCGLCFNPRPRVGGDLQELSYITGETYVSIHAPAWGATPKASPESEAPGCFNPRPRVGGDRLADTDDGGGFMFQSTPPRGGRPLAGNLVLPISFFSIFRDLLFCPVRFTSLPEQNLSQSL